MSQLTEFQIRALILRLEATLRRYQREERVHTAAWRRTTERLEAYRAELGYVTGQAKGGGNA
ncbi:MAG: hypothetical protein ACLPX8_19855 [Bryobacteraceae bacterium]|jgi:hypothetical protein